MVAWLKYRWLRLAVGGAMWSLLSNSAHAELFVIPPNRLAGISSALGKEHPVVQRVEANRAASMKALTEKLSVPHAHYELARVIVDSGKAETQAVKLVQHLQGAAEDARYATSCNVYLGRIFFAAGRFSESVKHYALVADFKPEIRYLYARSLHANGNAREARKQAERAQQDLRVAFEEQQPGSQQEIYWLACMEFLERFQEAADFLIAYRKDTSFGREKLSQLYFRWSQFLRQKGDLVQATTQAFQATQVKSSSEVESLLVQLVFKLKSQPIERRLAIAETLASGKYTAFAALQVGTTLCTIEAWEAGLKILEAGHKQSPADLDLLNNLAFFYSKKPKPDLERAMQYAESLVEKAGSQTQYRETRGQIHAKMGDWSKAKEDLLAAQPALPNHPELYLTLSTACRMLKQDTLADLYKKKLEDIVRRANAKP